MKSLAIIFVKILSLYFFVEFITEGIPQVIGIIYSEPSIKMGIIYNMIIVHVFKLIIIFYLWFLAEKVSNFIINNKKEIIIDKIDYKKINLILISIVGLIIIAINVPELVKYVIEYFYIIGRFSINIIPDIAAKIIMIIIGLWLLLKPTAVIPKNNI